MKEPGPTPIETASRSFTFELFLDKITSSEIYDLISKLITNNKLRITIQKKNFLKKF